MRQSGVMGSAILGGSIMAAFLLGVAAAQAGPWEDGMAAYNRGDYLPAIRLFRPLARQGNPKAQSVIGVMYRKGEGVPRSSSRAFMWFSLAARRGEAKARAGLRDFQKHDAGGNLAGPADGAGVRGFQLPRLRILIAVTASGASGPH